jgi:hypothetical protein
MEDDMGRACSTNGGRRGMHIRKPEGKIPLGRPRLTWVDNIKIDLRDRMGWYGLD